MSQELVNHLNIILRNELVAINQYFLHSKILQDQGFNKLAQTTKAESIDEMKHADIIIDRILFLKGSPQMTDYGQFKVGKSVEEIFKNDLELEISAISDLKKAISYCHEVNDIGTKDLLEKILISEEEHLDFIETQLGLIEQIGIKNYLVTQI